MPGPPTARLKPCPDALAANLLIAPCIVCLRKVIALKYANHMPEFVVASNTGMLRSEQYSCVDWSCVDLSRRDLFIPGNKNGRSGHLPLNSEALAAFEELHRRTGGRYPVFASRHRGEFLRGPRHRYVDAVEEAGLADFAWYDLRHDFGSVVRALVPKRLGNIIRM